MPTTRDNLVLIAAFGVALALHAALLPWVGAAVGEREEVERVDLVAISLDAPRFAKAGDEIVLDARAGELREGQQLHYSRFARRDAAWLSRDRTRDEADLLLGDVQMHGVSDERVRLADLAIPTIKATLPSDADGPYFLIYEADVDGHILDSNRSNNTRVAPIYIDGPQRPELAVEAFDTPQRAAAGGSVLIDFAIDNLGDGWASSNPKLGEHGWVDRIYLSTDARLDANDLVLRTIERTAPLGPTQGYRHNQIELDLPRGVTGPMYLILAADSDQQLDQPSFTKGFAARPIELLDTDRPDLIVATINDPGRLVTTRASPVTFSVANLGQVPTLGSSWIDGLYLSADDVLDADDLLLTEINASQPLQPRSRYQTTTDVTLPDTVEPGRWYLIIKADSGEAVDEAVFEDNNAFAIPVDVWTPEQADAEIKLGEPDRPERLVVQWIESPRLREHIARRSRTVQPALQSQVEPDPNAPIVDNPKPPALASAASQAAGDPNRQTPNTQETPTQETNPTTPDASATDVAPSPQTPGSPVPREVTGLPGDRGDLPTEQPGLDRPDAVVEPIPIDPTPSTDTTPTPDPGEREVPSPADPTAPQTDSTTDSLTPAEIESETDSKNPDPTEATTPSEEQAADPIAAPTPDTQDSQKPEGDNNDPASPSEQQDPTRAPKAPAEAVPTDIKITELELQEGEVLVGKGIKVTTKLPTPPGTGSRVLSIPRNARVAITFDSEGNVYEAKILRSTTYQEWDAAIEASLYRWRAEGEAVDKATPHITIEWDYLLNDLLGE